MGNLGHTIISPVIWIFFIYWFDKFACINKVETRATSLPTQSKSYLHMQNVDMRAAHAL